VTEAGFIGHSDYSEKSFKMNYRRAAGIVDDSDGKDCFDTVITWWLPSTQSESPQIEHI